MASIKLLGPPDYSAEEQAGADRFRVGPQEVAHPGFPEAGRATQSGTKQDLRERIQEALDEGDLTYERLVDFLDSVAPWGKQHVFLYRGPRIDMQAWKDPDHVRPFEATPSRKALQRQASLDPSGEAHALLGHACGRKVAHHSR